MSMIEIPETHLSGTHPRSYHAFGLSKNGLRCLVISDPTADKAAASVAVNAGQLQDVEHQQGIAHLTEHMLFMGSKTFPSENEYDQYLQQHGGHSNAYTDLEVTCFYFDIMTTSSTNVDGQESDNESAIKNSSSNSSSRSKLYGALERLACAMAEPLIDASSLERELQAVDSEHAKNSSQDHWRTHQLSRAMLGGSSCSSGTDATTRHPYAYFGSGNKLSLLEQVASTDDECENQSNVDQNTKDQQYEKLRNNILQFYKKYYIASNMTLTVLGNQSVDALQNMVETIFGKIPTIHENEIVPCIIPCPPLPDTPVQVVQWVPLRCECAQLELQWIIPTQWHHYKSKPSRYWSHLIGHEGPGSLLDVLRQLQWAQDLTADDISTNCRSFSLFTVTMELTTEGLKHVVDILDMLFYYTGTVLESIPDWVQDELKVTGDTSFRFLAKHDAANTCSSLAVHMHQYDVEHYLSGSYKHYAYDAAAVQNVGQCLRSSNSKNLLILVGSSEFEGQTDQVDKYYGTNYRVVPASDTNNVWSQLQERLLQKELNKDLIAKLVLPAQNDMLPTDFSLVTDDTAVNNGEMEEWLKVDGGAFGALDSSPRCLIDTPTCRLWYKPDSHYQSPKVNIMAILRSPLTIASPESAVIASLWVETVTELSLEFSYAASMAGLHWACQEATQGMEIQISGYNHKAGILLQRICDTIKTRLPATLSSNDQRFFERIRNKLEQRYHSALVAQPYQHGSMAVDLVLEATNKGFIQDRLAYLSNKKLVTSSVLLHFSQQMLSSFRLEILVHGNAMADEAKGWTNIILDCFQPSAPLRLPTLRGVELPSPRNTDKPVESIYRLESWNEHDENSCIVNIYQIGLVDVPTNAKLSLLLQLMREPAFQILRTKEQLGYIVFSSVKTVADNIKNLMFLIQSDSFDPVYLNDRIEDFLCYFRTEILVRMSAEEFQTNVDSLCDSLLQRNMNLSEESSKHWSVILNQTYRFHRLAEIASEVSNLSKVDILRFFDRYILTRSPFRRKLSAQIFGKAHQDIRNSLLSTAKPDSIDTVLIEDPDEFVRNQSLLPTQQTTSVESLLLLS